VHFSALEFFNYEVFITTRCKETTLGKMYGYSTAVAITDCEEEHVWVQVGVLFRIGYSSCDL